MKRFPSPRCASTIQIVPSSESTAETQPKLQPAVWRLSAMISSPSRAQRAMLGLNFAQTGSARNGSESGARNWGTVTQTEQNRECPPHDSTTEKVKPNFRNRRFFVRRRRRLTECSEPFAVRICSVQAVRSLSVGPQ
jgi:hypothetical protein